MDLKRTINGIIIFMVCIMQVASQHLPSRQTFKRDLPYDDDNYGNSNIESYFTPYQRIRQKQKFITATGNNEEKAPDEIAFDTYNMFGYPAMLKRLRQENKYWPTKDQNQLQQLQQTVATNSKGKQYEKSLQEQQKQSQPPLSSGFKPIKDNGNKFDDVLYPFDEKAANDAATEDQNVNENLTPTSSSQLPLQELNEKRQNDADGNTSENILNYFLMPESRRTDVLLQQRPIRSKNSKHQLSNFEKMQRNPIWSPTDDDDYLFLKRSAFPAYKRQKAKPQQTPFLPSISAGAMTNLGHFFTDLTNNVQFMENRQLNPDEKQLLDGEHPIAMLKEELMRTVDGKPNGAFLNTVRTYQPSQKIRSLIAMNPQGYHGSQFLDPNYYYIGLG